VGEITWLTIEKVAEAIIDYRGKTPAKSTSGVRLITAKVIKDGFVGEDNGEYISEETYSEWMRRGFPRQWDILVTTEAPLGEVAQLRSPDRIALAQRVILLRGDPSVIDQSYLYHALKSDPVQSQLRGRSSGTTVLGIKQSELRQVRIPVIELVPQRKIASILSAYDDLIENNLRRIKILEEMAQSLYKEWFVDLRFPGHESVEMVDSRLGLIPEGWEVEPLNSVLFALESGSRPTGGASAGGGVPSVGAENVIGLGRYDYSSEKHVPREFFEKMKRGRVASGDVLLYKDGANIGRMSMFRDGFPHHECCINEHVFILRAGSRCPQSYLFFYLSWPGNTERIRQLNTNAAQPGINQKGLGGLVMLLPDSVVHGFDEIVEPVLGEVLLLAKQNQRLRETRDLLLPRLISGELDVSELDIDVGKDAA
jgi:type I restriction enzyme, S subunit